MASILSLPAELVVEVMENLANPADLRAFLHSHPGANSLFARAGIKKSVLVGVLTKAYDPFALKTGRRLYLLTNNARTRIDDLVAVDGDIQSLAVPELLFLAELWLKHQPLVDCARDTIMGANVVPANWRFPYGRNWCTLTRREIHYPVNMDRRAELTRALNSGFLAFNLWMRMRGIAATQRLATKNLWRLFGMLPRGELIRINRPRHRNQPESRARYAEHLRRVTDLCVVTWFDKLVRQAIAANGGNLPARLNHLPGMIGGLFRGTLGRYGSQLRNNLEAAFQGPASAEVTRRVIFSQWLLMHVVVEQFGI